MLLTAVGVAACGGSSKQHPRSSQAAANAPSSQAPIDREIDAAMPAPEGSSPAGAVIVRVGNQTVTKGAFEREMKIEAYGQVAQGRRPIFTVPPTFTSCVSQLAALAEGFETSSSPKSSPSHLKMQCEALYDKYRAGALQTLISTEWLFGAAAEEGVSVSDKEARQRLKYLRKVQFPSPLQFEQYLQHTGQTVASLLFSVKAELTNTSVRNAIARKTPPITAATVASYYASEKARFEVPEKRDLGFIRTKHAAAAAQIKHELQAGVSFASIARRYASEQPFYVLHGLLQAVGPHAFNEPALTGAIFAAKPHVVSGPVHLNYFPGYHPRFHRNPADINNIDGYYIFEVQAIHPARVHPLSEVSKQLRHELPDITRRQAVAAWVKAWRAKWRARTDCSAGYVVRKCRQYVPSRGEQPEDAYTLD